MNPVDRCFCELAPLYALDLLDQVDRQWVEQQVVECPDLAAELADFQTAVAAIPYSAPAMPMAANLKERLFQRIEQPVTAQVDASPPPSTLLAAPTEETVNRDRSILQSLQSRLSTFFRPHPGSLLHSSWVRRSQNLNWQPYRVPGVMVAPLHIDWLRFEVTALVRAEPGVQYPAHRHAGFEEIYMLEGDLTIGETLFYAGDYIRSERGSIHAPETKGGCMFFVRTSLNDKYLQKLAVRNQ